MRKLKALLYLVLLAAVLYALGQVRAPRGALPARTGSSLTDVKTWGYQLQLAAPERVAAGIDLMVVDYARGARPKDTLSHDEVRRFQTRPDGSRRIVLAYLSVGEAENYRYYWQPQWQRSPPSWLAGENPEWPNNYRVRFWDPAWQRIIFEPRRRVVDRFGEAYAEWRKPYLDRILEAGFDGVYLDRVDAFYEWEKSRPSAEAEMAAFVTALSAYAKRRKPGFLIVPQNAEELLRQENYRRHIDAIAKEDLLFGEVTAEQDNKPQDVNRTILLLNRARADGLPVFVVEYLTDPMKRAAATRRAATLGYVLHFGSRLLNQAPELTDPGRSRP